MACEQSSGRKDKSARGEEDRGPRYPKLKRFLLRYDPKGIGLEVENSEGEMSVTHKNLPPESQVNTPSEVKMIAERVIGEEDTLLSRRRHGNALESLVARLYNIDMPMMSRRILQGGPMTRERLTGLTQMVVWLFKKASRWYSSS
jgi:hypothetical protein